MQFKGNFLEGTHSDIDMKRGMKIQKIVLVSCALVTRLNFDEKKSLFEVILNKTTIAIP